MHRPGAVRPSRQEWRKAETSPGVSPGISPLGSPRDGIAGIRTAVVLRGDEQGCGSRDLLPAQTSGAQSRDQEKTEQGVEMAWPSRHGAGAPFPLLAL